MWFLRLLCSLLVRTPGRCSWSPRVAITRLLPLLPWRSTAFHSAVPDLRGSAQRRRLPLTAGRRTCHPTPSQVPRRHTLPSFPACNLLPYQDNALLLPCQPPAQPFAGPYYRFYYSAAVARLRPAALHTPASRAVMPGTGLVGSFLWFWFTVLPLFCCVLPPRRVADTRYHRGQRLVPHTHALVLRCTTYAAPTGTHHACFALVPTCVSTCLPPPITTPVDDLHLFPTTCCPLYHYLTCHLPATMPVLLWFGSPAVPCHHTYALPVYLCIVAFSVCCSPATPDYRECPCHLCQTCLPVLCFHFPHHHFLPHHYPVMQTCCAFFHTTTTTHCRGCTAGCI